MSDSLKNINTILFDFGGCLDSDGVHSRTLFLRAFAKAKILSDIQNKEEVARFQDAYSFADKKIVRESLVLTSNLAQMNDIFSRLIASNLGEFDRSKIDEASHIITGTQATYLKRNKSILAKLAAQFQMGIVSNFSGNLSVILEEFELNEFFRFALDSYHCKVEKPSPEIFSMALAESDRTNRAGECVFIGDNPERDVAPAQKLGMKGILVREHGKDLAGADIVINSIEELLPLFLNEKK